MMWYCFPETEKLLLSLSVLMMVFLSNVMTPFKVATRVLFPLERMKECRTVFLLYGISIVEVESLNLCGSFNRFLTTDHFTLDCIISCSVISQEISSIN